MCIPQNVTYYGIGAFSGCLYLESIEVDPDNTAYASIDGVLYTKDLSVLMQCPAGKSGEFSIPDSVTIIGDYAFYGCDYLTSIIIPDSVTIIGDDAFSQCYKLTSVTIPNSVAVIGDYAFYGCTSLEELTIPDSVTRIGDRAFSYCESLKSITFKGNAPSIGSQWIFGASSDLTIYYNEGATGFDGPAWKDLSLQVISTLKGGSDDGLIVIGLVVFVAIAILAALLYMRKR